MKRKEFFKLTTAGAAGLTLGTSCTRTERDTADRVSVSEIKKEIPAYRETVTSSFSTGSKKSPGDRVILALIGAGAFGTNLILEAANSDENVQVKYICDVDETRGGRAITELEEIQGFRPIAVKDMQEVFDDQEVDGVFIATPEHWHALATIRACQAGKDVYVEKTISHNIFEGQQMIKAAMKYERIVQSGTQNRSADYAITARDYIKSGELGDIAAVHVKELLGGPAPFSEPPNTDPPDTLDWNLWLGPAPLVLYNQRRHRSWGYYWDYSGGYVTSGGSIHQMDLARLVLDNPGFPKSACCVGGRYFYDDNREMPDYQMTTFDYGNYVMTLETGHCTPYMQKTSPEVRFSDAFPDWKMNATSIKILGTKKMMYVGRMGGGWQVFDRDGNVVAQDSGRFPLKSHILDFIDCIRTRKHPKGDIVEGHNSSVLIHLANISYRTGNKQLLFSPEYEAILNDEKAATLARGSYRKGFEVTENV